MMQTFHAMNTDVTFFAPHEDDAREGELVLAVREEFEAAEHRFSRFRADSELARLNGALESSDVSVPLFDALVRARAYFDLTDGLFDPTIGGSLIALGYDRSFAHGALDRGIAAPATRAASFADVILDARTRTVGLPSGVTLDLGGMIKGHTVDQASRAMPSPSVIDAGGDALLRGDGVAGEGYLVEIEDPHDANATILTLSVRERAVATSASNRRHWRAAGEMHHHLIDPRTGRSAVSDLAQVTVLAASTERAEVFAKAVWLAGERDGLRFLNGMADVSAILVRLDGSARIYGEVEVFDA